MPLPDISLAQFNRIATGDYNAGQIDFKTKDDGTTMSGESLSTTSSFRLSAFWRSRRRFSTRSRRAASAPSR